MGNEADVLLKSEAFNAAVTQLGDVSFQAVVQKASVDKKKGQP